MGVVRMATGVAGVLVGLMVASCGASTGAPQTVTQTVIQTAPAQTGDSAAESGGAGITVVAPGVVGTSESAGSSVATPEGTPASATDQTADTGEPTTESAATTSSSSPATSGSAPATVDKVARAGLRAIGTQCDAVLRRADITKALGDAVSADQIHVSDVANADNQMIGRNKCYYGTSDLATARPLVVALAAFATEDAAARQLSVTISSEKDAGAAASTVDVSGHQVAILLRDGGFATVQSGPVTVSIAIAKGVVPDAKLKSALTSLMGAALAHLG